MTGVVPPGLAPGGAAKPEPGQAAEDDKLAAVDGFQEAAGNDPYVFTISDRKVRLEARELVDSRQCRVA